MTWIPVFLSLRYSHYHLASLVLLVHRVPLSGLRGPPTGCSSSWYFPEEGREPTDMGALELPVFPSGKVVIATGRNLL